MFRPRTSMVTKRWISSSSIVYLQSRHTQPCRRHGPIVDADCFHGSRQHCWNGQALPRTRHDDVELWDLCRQSAATLAETPSRLLDDPCARRLDFVAVGLWWQYVRTRHGLFLGPRTRTGGSIYLLGSHTGTLYIGATSNLYLHATPSSTVSVINP